MKANVAVLNAIFALALASPFLSCAAFAAQPANGLAHQDISEPNFFGSVALPVQYTRHSERWANAVRNTSPPALQALVEPARSYNRERQAQFVNAALNQNISYRFDTHPAGDHWATAAETVFRSAGDCEDFAIAKMHALRSLGVPIEDLYMTIAYDAAVGAVHAVLLVRSGTSYWVLDNTANRLRRQEQYADFHPIYTFSANRSWLHGYQRGRTPAAVKSLVSGIAQQQRLALGNGGGSGKKGVRAP